MPEYVIRLEFIGTGPSQRNSGGSCVPSMPVLTQGIAEAILLVPEIRTAAEFRERIGARQGELLAKVRREWLTIRRQGLAIREHRILTYRRRHRLL